MNMTQNSTLRATAAIEPANVLRRVGRGMVLSAEVLAGALCGILVGKLLGPFWSEFDWYKLQAVLCPSSWDAWTATGLAAGVLAGMGCAILHTRPSRPRVDPATDERTRRFLEELEQGIVSVAERPEPGGQESLLAEESAGGFDCEDPTIGSRRLSTTNCR
jgi:hypothetical protein